MGLAPSLAIFVRMLSVAEFNSVALHGLGLAIVSRVSGGRMGAGKRMACVFGCAARDFVLPEDMVPVFAIDGWIYEIRIQSDH